MVILVVFKVFLVVKNLEIFIQIVPERPIYYYCDEPLIIPTYLSFVEHKKSIDRSTLCSINSPFDLLHADIADLRFFAKSAVHPKYCLCLLNFLRRKFIPIL